MLLFDTVSFNFGSIQITSCVGQTCFHHLQSATTNSIIRSVYIFIFHLLAESVKKYFLTNYIDEFEIGEFLWWITTKYLPNSRFLLQRHFDFLERWRQIVWQQSIAKECRWFFRGHFWRFFPLAQSWRWWVPLRDLPSGEEL